MPTPLFNIPLLETSTFSVYESNNHYRILEALHNPRVIAIANTPPTNPQIGSWYQVGTTPTGEWVGHAGEVATQLSDYWHFLDPLTSRVQFYSTRNLLFNPASFILSNTFVTYTSGATTITPTLYYKTIVTAGSNLNLSALPAFKGEIAIANTGASAIAIDFYGSNANYTLNANSSRVFLSDGINVF